MSERDDLIDETVLRRSLRLEADEQAPRFDAAAIAAMAGSARPSARVAGIVLAAAAVTGVVGGVVWPAIFDRAPSVALALGDVLLDALIALATFLVPIAEIAAQPAIPLSLLVALGVAILHELRERREHAHVHAS